MSKKVIFIPKWNVVDKILARYRYDEVLKYVKKGSKILDVGCGNGELLKKIAGRIRSGVGIDLDIQNKTEGNIGYIRKNLENEKFRISEKFDVVTMIALIEHLSRPEIILKNIKKVMVKNGVLIITAPTPKSKLILEFLAFRLKIINEDSIRDHKTYFSKESLEKLLDSLGFKNLKHKYFQFGFNQIITARK